MKYSAIEEIHRTFLNEQAVRVQYAATKQFVWKIRADFSTVQFFVIYLNMVLDLFQSR